MRDIEHHPQRHFPRWTIIVTAVTLLAALAFALDASEWLRGGFGWRWRYIPVVEIGRVVPLALLLALYVFGGSHLMRRHLLRRESSAREILAWAFAGSVLLALAVAHSREGNALYTLFTRTVSEQAAGEHYYGVQIALEAMPLQNWRAVMAQYGGQVGTSPPGLFMLYSLSAHLLEGAPQLSEGLYRLLLPCQCHNFNLLALTPAQWSAAWMGILTPLWAGLAVFPLYAITRRLSGLASAKQAALWWALIPGVLMFATSSSTFFPLIALTVFWCLLRGLNASTKARVLWLIAAGVVYGLGLFLNFVFLPLAALYGFYTLLHSAFAGGPARKRLITPLIVGLWFASGALIVWGIYWLISGLTPLDLLSQALSEHLELDRPYAFWVWFHLWDWAVFTGLAFVGAWLYALSRSAARGPVRHRAGEGVIDGVIDGANSILPLALLLAVLALTVSGTTRGESGRIWLFLSPFVLVAAAQTLAAVPLRVWLALTAAQAVMTFSLAANLEVYGTPELTLPPAAQPLVALTPTDAQFIDANGDGFRLVGWQAVQEGDNLVLRLNWRGASRPLEAYYFAVTLVSPDGTTYAVDAWQPVNGTVPVTCWGDGFTVTDEVVLPLPENAINGEWWLSLAVYGDETLPFERLRVLTAEGEDTQFGFGPVQVSTTGG